MGPEEMMAKIVQNLPGKTGKSLEEWIGEVRAAGLTEKSAAAKWLKAVHGMGGVTASVVAWHATLPADYRPPTDEEMVNSQYSGKKSGLRLIYDRIAAVARSLGDDVEVGARETMVSLIRNRQFAAIIPATNSRIDLELALPLKTSSGRLVPVRSANDQDRRRVKVELTDPDQVDSEVARLLTLAYERDANQGEG